MSKEFFYLKNWQRFQAQEQCNVSTIYLFIFLENAKLYYKIFENCVTLDEPLYIMKNFKVKRLLHGNIGVH